MKKTANVVYIVTHAGYPLVTPIKSIAQAHAEVIEELTGDKVEIEEAPIVYDAQGAHKALMAMLMVEYLVGDL